MFDLYFFKKLRKQYERHILGSSITFGLTTVALVDVNDVPRWRQMC